MKKKQKVFVLILFSILKIEYYSLALASGTNRSYIINYVYKNMPRSNRHGRKRPYTEKKNDRLLTQYTEVVYGLRIRRPGCT